MNCSYQEKKNGEDNSGWHRWVITVKFEVKSIVGHFQSVVEFQNRGEVEKYENEQYKRKLDLSEP